MHDLLLTRLCLHYFWNCGAPNHIPWFFLSRHAFFCGLSRFLSSANHFLVLLKLNLFENNRHTLPTRLIDITITKLLEPEKYTFSYWDWALSHTRQPQKWPGRAADLSQVKIDLLIFYWILKIINPIRLCITEKITNQLSSGWSNFSDDTKHSIDFMITPEFLQKLLRT